MLLQTVMLRRFSIPLDSKQVEPGAEQQAAAAEGASEQTQHGSDAHGQANKRTTGTSLQEKS